MSNQAELYEISASVPGGFEKTACLDVQERTNITAEPGLGRLKLNILHEDIQTLKTLGCVDHLYAVVENVTIHDITTCCEEDAFLRLTDLIPNLPWSKAFEVWKNFHNHELQWNDKTFLLKKYLPDENSHSNSFDIPTFRATCVRKGKHEFKSPDVEKIFGGALNDHFNWIPKMKNSDMEIIVYIKESEVSISIGLTSESMHMRNISHFGPTTLRPTIAYNMLALCGIQTGDIVCDLMCGGGTIPIECSLNWSHSYVVCGDIHPKAYQRCKDNYTALNDKMSGKRTKSVFYEILAWDVCNLPLKDAAVDIFITDLPFGKRSGSKKSNWDLYLCALKEMARAVKPNGKACLLTQDEKCMIKCLRECKSIWHCARSISINIGGLKAKLFLLLKTS